VAALSLSNMHRSQLPSRLYSLIWPSKFGALASIWIMEHWTRRL